MRADGVLRGQRLCNSSQRHAISQCDGCRGKRVHHIMTAWNAQMYGNLLAVRVGHGEFGVISGICSNMIGMHLGVMGVPLTEPQYVAMGTT